MPKLSDMPPPGTLTGLELIPMLQGGGIDGNVGVPLLVYNAAFGGDVLALRVPMVADMSATAEADPGAAGVRWNNADPDAATELYINDADGDSGDLAALFASLTAGGYIYLQGGADSAARDNLQRWEVTSKSDESGYTKLGVTLKASGGAFTDDDALELSIQQPAPAPGDVTSVNGKAGAVVLTEGDVVAGVNAQTGTTYTAVLTDEVVTMDNESANEITIPPNSSVAFPVGRFLEIWQAGAGQTTIVAGSGVTILYGSSSTLKLKEKNSGASLRQVATDTWRLIGDMEQA